jgi:hypothetical protein
MMNTQMSSRNDPALQDQLHRWIESQQQRPPSKSATSSDDDDAFGPSEDRKRQVLELTLEELQDERDMLREKNRTNSQRFRDRKKDFMDTLFEEKYRLGKERNELKADNEKLQKLLQDALAEKELNQLQQRKSALMATKRTMPPPSLLYQDSLLRPSPYDGMGLSFGYAGAGMGAGLGISKGLFPGMTGAGMLGLEASSLAPLRGLKDEVCLFPGSSLRLGGMGDLPINIKHNDE